MSPPPPPRPGEAHVTVRYWAAARAAAGVEQDLVAVDGPTSLAAVLADCRALHPEDRFARVLSTCSVLVGERPVGAADPAQVVLAPGDTVELLPPFAGG